MAKSQEQRIIDAAQQIYGVGRFTSAEAYSMAVQVLEAADQEEPEDMLYAEGQPPPVFPIKATDALAYIVVKNYADMCRQTGLFHQADEAMKAAEEIRLWQHANIDLTKLPDHDHRPASWNGGEEETNDLHRDVEVVVSEVYAHYPTAVDTRVRLTADGCTYALGIGDALTITDVAGVVHG